MKGKLTWRWGLILAVTAAAVFFMLPMDQKIHLGLDLKGGIHLVLQVNTMDAVRAEVDDAMERVRTDLADRNAAPASLQRLPDGDGFKLKPAPSTDAKLLDKAISDRLADFKVTHGVEISATLNPIVSRQVKELAVRQALETIRNRVDQFGVSEPVIQRQGVEGDRIVVQLPGVDDPARVKELISLTAFLEIKPVVRVAPTEEALLSGTGGRVPEDSEVLPEDRETIEGTTSRMYYLVKKASVVTGRDLRNARRSQDQYGQPAVHFSLNPEGARKFSKYTGEHIGDQMAIVLDNKVRSAPTIRSQIGDEGIIEGSFTVQSAEDLALVLRAGALPASITYLEERTVGPSLGRDSIIRGLRAGLVGIVLVAAFMLIYYKGSGINADVALVLNAVLLLGAIGMLKATLTLPGIAGVILTIGMAVDSNVLVFERIREEMDLGKTVRNSVSLGFSRAFATIIDTHVTTIVSALFLFEFGTGPIKGFAVTLTVGLLISMFTAVFVSRTIFEAVLSRHPQTKTLSI